MSTDHTSMLAKLRSNLRRTGTDLLVAGAEGENLTRLLLNEAGLGWFWVEQEEDTKAKGLVTAKAKRTDFVIGWNGASVLLDSKCQNHDTAPDGSITFALEKAEIERLRNTGTLFGLDVIVIFWSRLTQKEKFVIDRLDRLTDPTTITDARTGKKKPALSATFAAAEIYELDRGRPDAM